ncbi:pro-resilin-like [Penaeus japonicus]|uniref:pro-resilin-like n=1 Tax=Penaeus japonicus TaxID=27405 RepID=UPI001C70E9FA|nr:pro-resilin-like [Penaeus japonicus]
MKQIAIFSLLAVALATPKGYPAVSSVWPPRVHRPYFTPSYSPTPYETISSYATVPTSSYISGSSSPRSLSSSSSGFAFPTTKRPVPSFALAPVKKSHPTYAPAHAYSYAPAKKTHDFGYSVNEGGNNFGHQQSDDGYTTKGSYYVDLPDGRRQKVSYYVSGDSGFVAEVTYEGVAHYPAPKPNYYNPVTTQKPAPYPPAPGYLVSSAHIPSPFHG